MIFSDFWPFFNYSQGDLLHHQVISGVFKPFLLLHRFFLVVLWLSEGNIGWIAGFQAFLGGLEPIRGDFGSFPGTSGPFCGLLRAILKDF